ncbi:MAG: hypothetical protein DRI86_02680 [Bacteroidetes bacterium]|nr:MAG: hypothetical protein DRI86_02680 [Bacteroidota bacterium]
MVFYRLSMLLISGLFLLSSCSKQHISNEEILFKIVGEINKHKSIKYDVFENYYYSNIPDTTSTSYNVWVAKDEEDSLRGGYIWVNNNYRPYNMVYDRGSFYLTIPPKKISILYSNYSESIITNSDWIDVFLRPSILEEIRADSNNQIFISDTIYDSEKCYNVQIDFPENNMGEKTTVTFFIHKFYYVPIYASIITKTNENTYTNELEFDNVEFDKVNINELRAKHKELLKANPLEAQKLNCETSALENMLHIGEKAPLFDGDFYNDSIDFKLENYIGKNIIIIDFWYTHCPPCVRAIPALSDLNELFKDKGLIIFGLNSVDNQARSLDNLNKFLSKRDISYDIIMTQPQVDIIYKIKAYPSMYIIDLNGNIAYVEKGYDKESFEKLKLKVKELLSLDDK